VQLIGLWGVLWLIPVLQQQVNNYSDAKKEYEIKSIYYIVEQLYYDIKILTCKQLGQNATIPDCNKGIYQDERLKFATNRAKENESKEIKYLSKYWIIYYIFTFFLLIGNYIEYRKEYRNS